MRFDILAQEYTDAYSIDLVRVAPEGYSARHVDMHNHAFYILSGEGIVEIVDKEYAVKAGSVVRIPMGAYHSLRNSGSTPLELLSIYDPPRMRNRAGV
jgi:mannose-6-phosphate isomerase-like protein (cupin superfamily)